MTQPPNHPKTTFLLALDFGASFTDTVVLHGKKILEVQSFPAHRFGLHNANALVKNFLPRFPLIRKICATGGQSRKLPAKILNLPVRKIPELEAVARGVLFQAKIAPKNYLAASLGTGACLVSVRENKFIHALGSGICGGTLTGLGKILCGTSDLPKLEALAKRGDLKKASLLIGELMGGNFASVSAHEPAAHFSKLAETDNRSIKPADLASALFALVGRTLGTVITLSALAHGQTQAILSGKICHSRIILQYIQKSAASRKIKISVSKHFAIATALGAGMEKTVSSKLVSQ
jgi:pantothenate kinase